MSVAQRSAVLYESWVQGDYLIEPLHQASNFSSFPVFTSVSQLLVISIRPLIHGQQILRKHDVSESELFKEIVEATRYEAERKGGTVLGPH